MRCRWNSNRSMGKPSVVSDRGIKHSNVHLNTKEAERQEKMIARPPTTVQTGRWPIKFQCNGPPPPLTWAAEEKIKIKMLHPLWMETRPTLWTKPVLPWRGIFFPLLLLLRSVSHWDGRPTATGLSAAQEAQAAASSVGTHSLTSSRCERWTRLQRYANDHARYRNEHGRSFGLKCFTIFFF